MSTFRIVASIIGIGLIAAFATKPVDAGRQAPAQAAAVAAKQDRSEISDSGWACAQEPWPYGCQWRTPSKRVIIRAPRPI